MRVIFVCVHAFSEKTKENITVKTYKIASHHNTEGHHLHMNCFNFHSLSLLLIMKHWYIHWCERMPLWAMVFCCFNIVRLDLLMSKTNTQKMWAVCICVCVWIVIKTLMDLKRHLVNNKEAVSIVLSVTRGKCQLPLSLYVLIVYF